MHLARSARGLAGEYAPKKTGAFFKIFSASGASIVESGLKWCAGCRGPLKQ
jgi:hypothetical protein